jgi:hypothetical protein
VEPKREQRNDYESVSGSSGTSLSNSARGTPIQFFIPENLNDEDEQAFIFDVLAGTQAGIATARQESRLRRSDQEETKGPQSDSQLDNQPLGGQQVIDDDVQILSEN